MDIQTLRELLLRTLSITWSISKHTGLDVTVRVRLSPLVSPYFAEILKHFIGWTITDEVNLLHDFSSSLARDFEGMVAVSTSTLQRSMQRVIKIKTQLFTKAFDTGHLTKL